MCRAIEQLPGVTVMVGGRLMRVSDPPPRILRIPVPVNPTAFRHDSEMSLAMDIDEYEWTGSSYHKIASR